MKKKYDLVIVGAGPAGAAAAKTAGENGLKVAVLDRKTNPAVFKRGDSQLFASDSHFFPEEKTRFFDERAYYNSNNGKIIYPVNGFSIDYNGPVHKLYAWHFYAPDGKTRLEFGNYEENMKNKVKEKFLFVMDKGKVIDNLLKEALRNKVDLVTGFNVRGIEKTTEGIKVTGNGDSYEGTFVMGADGVSSRIANLMGFNKERKYYGTFSGIYFYITGVKIPQSEAIITAFYPRPNTEMPGSFFLIPSPYAEGEYWIGSRSHEIFEYITKQSIYSEWFPDVKIRRIHSAVSSVFSPVSEPYKDNVLLVGDSAWHVEAEIIGSIMCGWKAAHSVTVALLDNQLNREGVLDYIEWWKKSYPEFDDYRNFQLLSPFRVLFTEKELNYLFNHVKRPLAKPSPFHIVRLFKQALEPMMSQIEREMPSAYEKIKMLEIEKIDEIFTYIKKKMSP
jgi:flavin-dependent dehydrogenase